MITKVSAFSGMKSHVTPSGKLPEFAVAIAKGERNSKYSGRRGTVVLIGV